MTEFVLHISAGEGPRECHWVVARLALAFEKEAKSAGLKPRILWEEGEAQFVPSCFVEISGDGASAFANTRVGTVRWIGKSKIRPNHKRKNWYVSVSKAPLLERVSSLQDKDIRYQSLKASGPGGQHVNKTETAIRATHGPTGIVVVAQEERSQFANKRIAKMKLAMKLQEREEIAKMERASSLHLLNKSVERGNEIAIYEGEKFRKTR